MKTEEIRMPAFRYALGRFRLRWQAGLALAGLLRAVTWVCVVFLAFGVLDYFASLGDGARRAAAWCFAAIGAWGLLRMLWDTITFMRRDAAREADRALASKRREVLSALELQSRLETPATPPLTGWLYARAVSAAAGQLASLGKGQAFPRGRVRGQLARCGVVLGVVLGCFLLASGASWIIARRLLIPSADIPPYTRLHFDITPANPGVIYGGDVLITTEITGGTLRETVRCLTRDPATGTVEESPAFEESPTRFSRKLEKVSAPLEIAFAAGRARSNWIPVAVRMQPKIQEVLLTIQPPAYSKLPSRQFALGSQELAALRGSRITAEVVSNRPLGSGRMAIRPSGVKLPNEEVASEKQESHRVKFSWTLQSSASLALVVTDITGTDSEPLRCEQKMTPDARPEAVLRQPSGDVLATPDAVLPFEIAATDDLGLSRVSLIRHLAGYRERAVTEPIRAGERKYETSGTFAMAGYGLNVGDTIDLSLEAADTNPTLLGVTASDPAHIHIVSREQYAAMLRAQTTLEDFAGRFKALQEAMDAARDALAQLRKAAEAGDAGATEEALKKAAEAHQKLLDLYNKIAKDFPIFDLDKELAASAKEAMSPVEENLNQLNQMQGHSPQDVAGISAALQARLGAAEKKMAAPMEEGARAEAAGAIFEQAGRFNEIVQGQRDFVKELNRIIEASRRGEMQTAQAFQDLAARQRALEQDLDALDKALSGAVQKLPNGFDELKDGARKFLDVLHQGGIPPVMEDAARGADQADSKKAGDQASEALARLESLLRKGNSFCGMCRGQRMQFPWPQDLATTLAQLMQCLIPKPGGGNKPGSGDSGPGGYNIVSEYGSSMPGNLPQLPIFGPSRLTFSHANRIGAGRTGRGPGNGAGANTTTSVDKVPPAAGSGATNGQANVLESVPEAYREAVKRYFSSDEQGATAPPTQAPTP